MSNRSERLYNSPAARNAEYDRIHGGKRVIQLAPPEAASEPAVKPKRQLRAKGRYLRRKSASYGETAFIGYAGTQGDNPHTSREIPPWE